MAKQQSIQDDALLAAIDAAASSAYGSDTDSALADERALAIDRYLGKNIYQAAPGTSQVVDRSTFDTISWILPSLIRIFTSSPELVVFDPVGPEDENLADQESAYTSMVVQQQNDWFQVVHDWFMDALLTKQGYAMAWYDDSESFDRETYEGQSSEALALMLQSDDVEIVQHSAYPDPDAQPQKPQIDPQTGQPQPPQPPPMLHDVVVKRSRRNGRVRISVLPPERTLVSHHTPSFRLTDCPYFEYWDYATISDLRSQGFDVDDDIGDESGTSMDDTPEDQSRNQYDESTHAGGFNVEAAMRRVKVRTCWIRHDYEGNGRASMHRAIIVGSRVLDRRDVSRITVSAITPSPLPHRHIGMSVDDMVKDLAEIKTALLRQGLNSLYLSNFPRMGVTDKVNLDDLMDVRAGGYVRIEEGGIPANELMPIVTPNSFPQALQGLEYIDSIKQNRTGVNSYFSGLDQNALGATNRTASGIAQLTSSAAQRVEQIARVFGAGVQELFSIVHQLILEHGHKKETVRLRGDWTDVDPRAWKNRNDLRINVGMGTGNREQVMAHLQNIFQVQMGVGQLGLVKPEHLFNTLSEMVKAAGFASPEKFFADPQRTPPPPQQQDPRAAIEQAKLQLEGKKLELDAKKLQQESQDKSSDARRKSALEVMQGQIDLLKIEIDHYKADMQAATQIKIADMGHAAASGQMDKQHQLNGAAVAAERTLEKNLDDASIGNLTAMLDALRQQSEALKSMGASMLAPRKVLRDEKTGRVIGMAPDVPPEPPAQTTPPAMPGTPEQGPMQ